MPKCGNCKADHGSAQEVRDCYGIGQPVSAATVAKAQTKVTQGATEKQVAFLTKLCAERPAWAEKVGYNAATIAGLSKAGASGAIGDALAQPKEAKAASETTTTATGYTAEAKKGDVHVVDGSYYRIHIGQKSGKPYVCKATIRRDAEWGEDGSLVTAGSVGWDIAKGFINKLSQETKATPEQAAAFGHLVGRCCFCSHAIDTPESTAVGYGPVCAGKYDLPWGDTTTTLAATA